MADKNVQPVDPGLSCKIADINLADWGRKEIELAEEEMPGLMAVREKYGPEKPLKGMKVMGSLHMTIQTAVLIETLAAAGAQISWSGCNPLSTQDEIAAALVEGGSQVYAWHGMNTEEFYWCIEKTLEQKPTLTLDDGADLIFTLHNRKIIVMHEHHIVDALADSGHYDLVIYGHTHKPDIRKVKNTLIVNPGEVSTWLYGTSTIAIADLEKMEAQIVEL